MTETLTCPRCQHPLALREKVADPWLTCPHCLASVRNPHPEQFTAEPPTPVTSACRVCGEELRPHWRLCPRCGSETRSLRPAASLDRDLKKDQTGGMVALGILGFLFVVGSIFFLAEGGGEIFFSNFSGFIALLTLGTTVVGVVALVLSGTTIGKVVGGMLGGIAIFILFLCAGLMALINSCRFH